MWAISGQSYLISSVLICGAQLLASPTSPPYPIAFIATNTSRDSDLQAQPCVGRRHFYSLHRGYTHLFLMRRGHTDISPC
jgi:hypothetical protein